MRNGLTSGAARCGVAKYVRLRQEFQEKEEHMREDVEKMRREFEERMDKMKGEVQKIQEEKVGSCGGELSALAWRARALLPARLLSRWQRASFAERVLTCVRV